MSLIARPRPATWFQLLCAKDDLFSAMEALSRMGAVELEEGEAQGNPLITPAIAEKLEAFLRLKERYRHFWPETAGNVQPPPGVTPLQLLDDALAALSTWQQEAGRVVDAIHAQVATAADLNILKEWMEVMLHNRLDPRFLRKPPGGPLAAHLFVIPGDSPLPPPSPTALMRWWQGSQRQFMAVVATPEEMNTIRAALSAAKGRVMDIPPWISRNSRENDLVIRKRLENGQAEQKRLRETLARLNERHGLKEHLRHVAHLQWFFGSVEKSAGSENLAWVTGWTAKAGQWNQALTDAGVRAMVGFPPPPENRSPPLLLDNPKWAKPFEFFPKLLGVPGETETDPSRLLALLAPFLFGFMFADVGQGLVLAGAGFFLEKRWPQLRLLTVFGLSATLFGFLFGSIFCLEDRLPALWFHPMAHPLLVLGIPLGLGVGVILAGLGLKLLQAHWRGETGVLTSHDAAIIVIYSGLLLSFFTSLGGFIALGGLGLFLFGHGPPHAIKALISIAELFEHLMQMAVNTLSFSRVGAFALAHSGLSVAVVALADTAGGGFGGFLVLLAGNVVILLLEGLVVSVQTTRLILFEFFVRFLKGEGRPFKPLPEPPA